VAAGSPLSVELRVLESGALHVLAGGGTWLRIAQPFRLCMLGHEPLAGGYDTVSGDASGHTAVAHVQAPDGTGVDLVDRWRVVDRTTVQVDRRAEVTSAGASAGLRLELRADSCAAPGEWQFFIPGALYNRNDTDHDGVEDYLGTYAQDFRDDRLASLAVLAYLPGAGRYVALTRHDAPAHDTAIPPEDRLARHFVQATDIGSLGLAPASEDGQVTLRASYPFREERSFCLNTAGDGWAAYLENRPGQRAEVSYRLHVATAGDLTDAIWDITRQQMDALGTRRSAIPFTLEEAIEHRTLLTQQYYREWTAAENPKAPAGYLVHFSPRTGRTQGALLEYGFSGAQTLLAYTSIRSGYDRGVALWIERARRVIDFFVRECQLESGFSHGIYDTDRQDFVFWFTGVLLPFQYSSATEQVRRYLGSQVTDALMGVAEALRKVQGNYTRTMCESMYPVLLAYRAEREHGHEHPEWLEAGRRFGDFLLRTQAEDGSWQRAYDPGGAAIAQPPQWFGASATERKSGSIFPIQVLVTLHELTGEERYLAAARRAGDFIIATYVDPVEYVGGLNDTTHVKSVKTDSVGVMFVMRSLIKLHAGSGERRFLDGALKAARILASWVYLWDVPMPVDSLLGRTGFRSTGWAVCDVIPGGSYLDNELLEFVGDLVDVAAAAGEERLFDVAEIVEYGMQHALSTPHDMLGYVAPGIQCEGVMTAYWLSDPEQTEFSGAVNKVKGEDNDTANGLTNGQAAYGLFQLRDRYGTADFASLRSRLFRG
jgi:hypothetical protein